MAFSFSDAWRNRSRTGGGQTVTTQPVTPGAPTPATQKPFGIDMGFQGDWAGSARETKRNYYFDQINQILGAGGAEAEKLYNLEESRGQKMEDIVRGAAADANVPTMSEQDIRRQFGRSADDSTKSMLGQMDSLRSYLGGAGITGGGLAAGMAAQFQLARAGQMTDARRALFLEKSKADALDRARNFQNQLTLASAVNRPVSMLKSDWLGQMAGIRLGQEGILEQRSAAKDAAEASKQAGIMSGIGGLAGGIIGAIA